MNEIEKAVAALFGSAMPADVVIDVAKRARFLDDSCGELAGELVIDRVALEGLARYAPDQNKARGFLTAVEQSCPRRNQP